MAVKPAKKTAICNCISAFFIAPSISPEGGGNFVDMSEDNLVIKCFALLMKIRNKDDCRY